MFGALSAQGAGGAEALLAWRLNRFSVDDFLTLSAASLWHLHGPLASVCAELAVDVWTLWLWAAGAPRGGDLYTQRAVTKGVCALLLAAAAAAAAVPGAAPALLAAGAATAEAPPAATAGALIRAMTDALVCPQLICAALFVANLVLSMQGHRLSVGLPDPAAITE